MGRGALWGARGGGSGVTALCPRSDAALRRYELQPPGTFPRGPGPEFKTTVTVRTRGVGFYGGGSHLTPLCPPPPRPQVQNSGCYPVRNVTLRMALPALGFARIPFLSVTRVLADNVSPPSIWGSGGSLCPRDGLSSSPPPGHLHPAAAP